MSDRAKWHPMAKLMIGADEKFFGPGVCELLERIQATGSVRLACAQMGLSYSKAWHILNVLEKEAGFQVVIRKKGGAGGGETKLTDEGCALLKQYGAYAEECKAAINAIFERHFPSND